MGLDTADARNESLAIHLDNLAQSRNAGPDQLLRRMHPLSQAAVFVYMLQREGQLSPDRLQRHDNGREALSRQLSPALVRGLVMILVVTLAASACGSFEDDLPGQMPTPTSPVAAMPTMDPGFLPPGHPDISLATAIAEDPAAYSGLFERFSPGSSEHAALVAEHGIDLLFKDASGDLELAVGEDAVIIWSEDPEHPLYLPVPPGEAELTLMFTVMRRSTKLFDEADRPARLPLVFLINGSSLGSYSVDGYGLLIPEFSVGCGDPMIGLGYDPRAPIETAVIGAHELIHKWGDFPDGVKELITRAYTELMFGYKFLSKLDQGRFYARNINGVSMLEWKGYQLGALEVWLDQMGISIQDAAREIITQEGYGDPFSSTNVFAWLAAGLTMSESGCTDHSNFFIELEEWYQTRTGRSFRSYLHEYHLRLLAGGEGLVDPTVRPQFLAEYIPVWQEFGTWTFPAAALAPEGLFSYSVNMFFLPEGASHVSIDVPEGFSVSVVPVTVGTDGVIYNVDGGFDTIRTAGEGGHLEVDIDPASPPYVRHMVVLTYGEPETAAMAGGVVQLVKANPIEMTISG